MNVLFESRFEKDIKRVRNRDARQKLKDVILAAKEANDLSNLPQLRKLKGHNTYYRIRIGDYRVGIEIVDNAIIFVRFLHRKDIYKYFP